MNRHLEEENSTLKSSNSRGEARYYEELLRNNELADKLKRSEADLLSKDRTCLKETEESEELNKKIDKMRSKENEMSERVKLLEGKNLKVLKLLQEKTSEAAMLNQII